MRKILLVVIATSLFFPALGFSQPDFRKATWGMTQAQVTATEPAHPSEVRSNNGETIVEYGHLKMGALDVRVLYIFAKDKLVRGRVLFVADHSEANDFIADFQVIEPLLKEQYGKPGDDRAIWVDDSTQDETKNYLDQDRATATGILPSDRFVGLAVALGHLKLYTRRNNERTEIWHTLWGVDNGITHEIDYHSVSLEAFEKQVRDESTKAN